MNQHDLDAMVGCLDPSYRSEQPAHPNRVLWRCGAGSHELVHAADGNPALPR